MRRAQWRKVAQYVKNSRYRSAWRKAVQVMACIVVFCTTYALILPAITQEKTYFCGLEAHEHTDACYEQQTQPVLVCQIPEQPPHMHHGDCYVAEELVCTLEEQTEHTYEESCLDSQGQIVCGMEECHVHGESCYAMETRDVLTCQQEVHIHVDACRADPNADLETPEDWESTLSRVELTGSWAQDLTAVASSQVGYQESEENYLAEEGHSRKGYTRYGAWYGVPYGEWDAMFASFCLHYAGIPQQAISWDSDSGRWLENLRSKELTASAMDKVPGTGDLLFYRDSEETPVRTAIVLALEKRSDENGEHTAVRVIEGGREDQVLQRLVDLEEITILGCCGTELVQQSWEAQTAGETTEATQAAEVNETSTTSEAIEATEAAEPTEETGMYQLVSQTAETENYSVTVTYNSALDLPEGTELRVVEYPRDSDIFRQRCQEAGYELEWLLNIGFFLGEEELALDGTFGVLVTSKLGGDLGQDITHFADGGAERITGADVSETAQEGQTAVAFSAEGFSDFGGGVAVAAETDSGAQAVAAGDTIIGFHYTTADPNQLKENTNYVIYTGNGTSYNFMSATLASVRITGNDSNSPYQVGRNWSVNADTMGTTQVGDMAWRVVKSGSGYYLLSQSRGTYLKLNNGWSSLENQYNSSVLYNSNVYGAAVEVSDGTFHIRYEDEGGWKSTWHNDNWSYWTAPTPIYFAEVTPVYASSGNYPDAVHTGSAHVDRLRFYNICESAEAGVTALANCVFQIEGTTSSGQKYSTTIISDESPQIALPSNIPDGVYTIKEISVPEGYMRDLNHTREFWIENGALVSDHNIGTFLNHKLDRLTVDKTGEVEDYNNRIYQILLNAKANLRMYQMDPIEVLFLVDKSNSMLFPSGMVDTGKSITLRTNDANNVWNNQSVLDSLDKSKMHYIIADPSGTATVYAVWHDGTAWLYQDASYYAKAKFENADGYESSGEVVIFPGDRSYSEQSSWEDGTYGTHYRSNGGGLNRDMSGSTLGNYIDNSGGTVTFRLYTAKDQYNRLHYLEEALANMIYELADANHDNKVVLIPFTKEVQTEIYYPLNSNNAITQPVTLTTSNTQMLFDIVTHVNTSGGTRQDLALEYAYETYLNKSDEFDKVHTYTILVTDGAPVRSGSSAPPLGNPNSEATLADDGEIYGRIKGWGGEVRAESTLMTVALGMEFVEGGRQVLEAIASDDDFYCALDDASALTQNMQKILFDGMKDIGELLVDNAQVVDEITDSFYPIAWHEPSSVYATGRTVLTQSNDKAWLMLQEGDWITLEGKFTTADASDAAGQLLRKDDGTYYIRWQNQTISSSGWKGTFYVKAKEDFIGGNAIDTNKDAYVTVNDATMEMDTPTVNVHLLELNQNSSQLTVYLGDTINGGNSSPRDVLRDFYNQIGFGKIQDESQITYLEMLNRLEPDSSTADGLERNFFFLKYALGYQDTDGNWIPRILTNDEWATLESGGSLTFPYVYDDASSHGNVGQFIVTLNKTGGTYDEHTADSACQPGGMPLTEDCTDPAETYTLTVTYTAYELGEQGRPQTNVNNGTGSPGTEVTKEAKGLNNGQGIITSENIHEVHVISGKIVIEKIFTENTEWTAGDTFTFQLTGPGDAVNSKTVTIGEDGTATAVFEDLARGTYTVTEAMHEDYAVKAITVGADTNAYYTQSDPMQVSFTMGNNLENENVIGKVEESDAFTSYIDPVNGVYGEAVFSNAPRIYTGEVPVEKIWDDGAGIHEYDQVYLALYLDGQPVLDTDGNGRLLMVDAFTGWEGIFTVVLADKNDSVDNYNYSVREVANTSDTLLNGWHPAILENDGETLLYYDEALEDGGLLGISGKGYIVGYTTAEDGTLVVTNYKGFDLPETGGMGTHGHTIGGLACILAALMYGYSLRRKRERGANS